MELKRSLAVAPENGPLSLNRTFMELKRSTRNGYIRPARRLNRTFMELKREYYLIGVMPMSVLIALLWN